jgi:sigma-B regulation protein RsbU (phosphoserine phosphatase)
MNSDEKKTILIIDDDLTIRKLLGHHLKNNNYTVIEASNPEEGFNHLKKNNIDLVLCDVTMDGMDGFTFCKKVREDENYRALPFVFVTAKSTMEDKSKAIEVGGDDIITKPFDVNELLIKVGALLKRSAIYKVYGIKKNLAESFAEDTWRVLLIDDDVSLAKLFKHNLDKAGFDCRIEFDGGDGFKAAKSFLPDIIVSDIMMPNMDGFTLRKKILEDPVLRSIPFVFLTAKSEEKDVMNGYDHDITDYVIKTSGPKILTAKVKAILKGLGKERQKIVSELHHAADSLRVKVVPDSSPVMERFLINHWHQAFRGIPGGDFIDYLKLDNKNLAIVLGDVMGKKWGAWYFAFAYAGYVRSAIRVEIKTAESFSPSKILQRVNKSVYQDAKVSEVFATLSILIINEENKTIKYTGAGDLPIIFRNGLTGEIENIRAKGSLLGFVEDGEYEDVEISMKKDDLIFMATDGITESRNKDGEQFGKFRFYEVLNSMNKEDDPLQKVKLEFEKFTAGNFEDDVSIITVKTN